MQRNRELYIGTKQVKPCILNNIADTGKSYDSDNVADLTDIGTYMYITKKGSLI